MPACVCVCVHARVCVGVFVHVCQYVHACARLLVRNPTLSLFLSLSLSLSLSHCLSFSLCFRFQVVAVLGLVIFVLCTATILSNHSTSNPPVVLDDKATVTENDDPIKSAVISSTTMLTHPLSPSDEADKAQKSNVGVERNEKEEKEDDKKISVEKEVDVKDVEKDGAGGEKNEKRHEPVLPVDTSRVLKPQVRQLQSNEAMKTVSEPSSVTPNDHSETGQHEKKSFDTLGLKEDQSENVVGVASETRPRKSTDTLERSRENVPAIKGAQASANRQDTDMNEASRSHREQIDRAGTGGEERTSQNKRDLSSEKSMAELNHHSLTRETSTPRPSQAGEAHIPRSVNSPSSNLAENADTRTMLSDRTVSGDVSGGVLAVTRAETPVDRGQHKEDGRGKDSETSLKRSVHKK